MLTRHPDNPVLCADDLPYDASLVFNAGVCQWRGEYVMVFRNDTGFARGNVDQPHTTLLGIARSSDGIRWTPDPEPVSWRWPVANLRRAYDPRLTVVEGTLYMCCAVDTTEGIRGGIARLSDDLTSLELLGLSTPDNRNMVLFPEKVDGKFCRFERPFPVYGRKGGETFDIWFGDSLDLRYWGNHHLAVATTQVSWCNSKIGPGAPPVRTERGWLAPIHVVDNDPDRKLLGWEPWGWTKRYTAALALFDLAEPWRLIGLSTEPLLIPTERYELDGFRGSVIFPGGFIAEDDGSVKLYYGAADTVVALATGKLDDLLAGIAPAQSPEVFR